MPGARAILLMGATATGKTELAVRLAEEFPMEIISVDSALIYRGMDIGTAKPDAQLLQRAPHFLIDIVDPAKTWSAWDFVRQASKLMADIQNRGHIPLLVGGTMMYFNALQQGLNDLPMADKTIRHQLDQRLKQEGLSSLYDELMTVDRETACRLKPTDTQRILRGLEVFLISGQPMSELIRADTPKPDMEFTRLILDVTERASLHRRIENRFGLMLEQGFEQEVQSLRQRGDLDLTMPSMRCVGYRQMWMYLDGEFNFSEMTNKSVAATRQLAKRQMTWLRKYEDAKRFNYLDVSFSEVCQSIPL